MNSLPNLTPAEFEIMQVVWDNGPSTLSKIRSDVNSNKVKQLQKATIQVQIRRLEKKGWLNHRKIQGVNHYYTESTREDVSIDMTKSFADKVFNGSCYKMMKCLVNKDSMTKKEIGELRNLLDNLYEGDNSDE